MAEHDKRELLKTLLQKQASPGGEEACLSAAQLRLWELEAHEAPLGTHTFAIAYHLKGPLNVELLEQALHAVASYHSGLRMRIATEGDSTPHFEPVRVDGCLLERYECPASPAGDAGYDLEGRLREEAALPLDPGVDRGWRCALFTCSDEEHDLLVRFHHIIADRWSVGVFVSDVGKAYRALVEGSGPVFAERPSHGAIPDDIDVTSQLAFWQGVFSEPAQPLELPLVSGSTGFSGYAGGRIEAELEPETVQALKALAAAESTTLFPVLLAAFGVLFRAHTGQEDLVLCTPVLGRHRASTRHVIGYLNNILPLRLDLQGDPSFGTIVGHVTEQARAAYANQDVPFQRIASLPELDGVRTTRCLFAVQNIPGLDLRLPGVESTYRDIPNGTANFDLSMFLEEKGGRIVALLDYKTAVFSAEAAEELKNRFVTCLERAAARPDAKLSEFPDYRNHGSAASDPTAPTAGNAGIEPDNVLEERVIGLWRDLFQRATRDSIGPNTNFFAVGGDSLKAARLFARLKQEFDLDLPLATLIEAPTPRKLAWRLADKKWVAPWLSLIALQTAGSRPPLYFLPGGGGNILCFRQIADRLGEDQPVYSLQGRGLKPGERPHRTVEEMAAYYVDVIRHARPHGPYLLAGHSLGAIVAYEMARLLTLEGEDVPLVGLFDHCGPDIKLSPFDYLRYNLANLYMLPPRERLPYVANAILWRLKAKRRSPRRKSAATPNRNAATAKEKEEYLRFQRAQKLEAAMQALSAYQIPPSQARVTLFRAQHHPKIRSDRYGGWGRVAGGGVDVHDVTGTHMSMLEEPHVQILAAKLEQCIDRIVAQQSSA